MPHHDMMYLVYMYVVSILTTSGLTVCYISSLLTVVVNQQEETDKRGDSTSFV